MKNNVAIAWQKGRPQGRIEVKYGSLKSLSIKHGKGKIKGEQFAFASDGPCRLVVVIEQANIKPGAEATLITIRSPAAPFSFFLRDVSADHPIFMREFNVIVTEADDKRSYDEMEAALARVGGQTAIQNIEHDREECYAEAAANTRELRCPTWLGLSRDIRIFELGFPRESELWCWIQPRHHGGTAWVSEDNPIAFRYVFMLGRGIGCVDDTTRRLENGVLPILHTTLVDGHIKYNCVSFVTLEKSGLLQKNLRGTHFLVADSHGVGHMFTEEQKKLMEELRPDEMNRDEETVLYFRAEAVNTSPAPRYAWFRNVFPSKSPGQWHLPPGNDLPISFDGKDGLGIFAGDKVFCSSKINGRPMPQEEMAVLLKPGGKAVFEFRIPHRPIDKNRALRLMGQDFEKRHAECRLFWRRKLEMAAGIQLPEKRVNEMVQTGLLHLDLVTYGREPKGTLAATIGKYCPIGSESSPIIQFMDSMGWHELAERSLQYFLDKQHEDGFIQNFGGYMLETGAALWCMGEHYRYTRDEAWVKRIASKLLKSCDYLIRWRTRNKRPELRGKGYGLLEGKCADPEDPFHSFMLNGYAYLGLQRVSEMLARLNPRQSAILAREAAALKRDIRSAFLESMNRSPVVPLGNGAWCPSAPPWVEATGPLNLFVDPGSCYTHGTFTGRDSMLGPLWLIYQEVLDAREQVSDWLIQYHTELWRDRNVEFSQPYYSRHDWVHLKRGEIRSFLKCYYNTFASLADRQTYSFWEHFFHASPHKTHEEAWFLMQTRWMLYMEDGQTLNLLSGIPRAWLSDGNVIRLKNVKSYFGPLSVEIKSHLANNEITAIVDCRSPRKPAAVSVRLPHPDERLAQSVEGGQYCPERETIVVNRFSGHCEVRIHF